MDLQNSGNVNNAVKHQSAQAQSNFTRDSNLQRIDRFCALSADSCFLLMTASLPDIAELMPSRASRGVRYGSVHSVHLLAS